MSIVIAVDSVTWIRYDGRGGFYIQVQGDQGNALLQQCMHRNIDSLEHDLQGQWKANLRTPPYLGAWAKSPEEALQKGIMRGLPPLARPTLQPLPKLPPLPVLPLPRVVPSR